MVLSKTASETDVSIHSTFASRYVRNSLPRFKMPENSIPKEAAYQIINDELTLDGNPRLNLVSFVTPWMEPECDKLMMAAINKNYVDMDEYPVTTEVQRERGMAMEQNNTIQHCPLFYSYMHSQHPLKLVYQNDCVCDVCGDRAEGLIYGCTICEYNVHTVCTQLPQFATLQIHSEHPLQLQPALASECKLCQSARTFWCYSCENCDFNLHPNCASKLWNSLSPLSGTPVFPPPPPQVANLYGNPSIFGGAYAYGNPSTSDGAYAYGNPSSNGGAFAYGISFSNGGAYAYGNPSTSVPDNMHLHAKEAHGSGVSSWKKVKKVLKALAMKLTCGLVVNELIKISDSLDISDII